MKIIITLQYVVPSCLTPPKKTKTTIPSNIRREFLDDRRPSNTVMLPSPGIFLYCR